MFMVARIPRCAPSFWTGDYWRKRVVQMKRCRDHTFSECLWGGLMGMGEREEEVLGECGFDGSSYPAR
jgi:biotin synthase-like enzyme